MPIFERARRPRCGIGRRRSELLPLGDDHVDLITSGDDDYRAECGLTSSPVSTASFFVSWRVAT